MLWVQHHILHPDFVYHALLQDSLNSSLKLISLTTQQLEECAGVVFTFCPSDTIYSMPSHHIVSIYSYSLFWVYICFLNKNNVLEDDFFESFMCSRNAYYAYMLRERKRALKTIETPLFRGGFNMVPVARFELATY